MLKGLDGKLGNDDYSEPLEILTHSLNKHNKFNSFGKIAFNHQLKNRLKTRKHLHQLHLTKTFSDPSDPVFVIGLPSLVRLYYSISYLSMMPIDLLNTGKL